MSHGTWARGGPDRASRAEGLHRGVPIAHYPAGVKPSSPIAVLLAPVAGAVAGLVWALPGLHQVHTPHGNGLGAQLLVGILFALACTPQVALVDRMLNWNHDGATTPSTVRPLALGATGLSSGLLLPVTLWLPLHVLGVWPMGTDASVRLDLVSGTAGLAVALVAVAVGVGGAWRRGNVRS